MQALYGFWERFLRICFCTIASLQALKYVNRDSPVVMEQISENILTSMVKDKKIDIDLASDMFFSSKTFADIANKEPEHYKQDWRDIYKKLQEELDF